MFDRFYNPTDEEKEWELEKKYREVDKYHEWKDKQGEKDGKK